MSDVREALGGLVRDAPLNAADWGDVVARSRAMGRRHVPRPLALVAAVVAILAVVLATPAFGLQGQISHLFTASNQKRPPELIQRFFRNLDVVPGGAHGVIPR